MKTLALLLALLPAPLFAQSADGQRYGTQLGAAVHVMAKSSLSAGAYVGFRRLGVSRGASVLLSTVGVFVAAKGVELAKGHRLGPWDTVHDFAAHGLFVLPLASRRGWPAIGLGLVVVGLCPKSSPRWC